MFLGTITHLHVNLFFRVILNYFLFDHLYSTCMTLNNDIIHHVIIFDENVSKQTYFKLILPVLSCTLNTIIFHLSNNDVIHKAVI